MHRGLPFTSSRLRREKRQVVAPTTPSGPSVCQPSSIGESAVRASGRPFARRYRIPGGAASAKAGIERVVPRLQVFA